MWCAMCVCDACEICEVCDFIVPCRVSCLVVLCSGDIKNAKPVREARFGWFVIP